MTDISTSSRPSPDAAEVRAQLERILASRCFEQALRSSKFLRYAVERTLAGEAERLKGYTIAVEVFERPPDFDAQNDPLVRVEAGRLRRRLVEYYAREGRADPVLVDVPRGAYSVTTSYRSVRETGPGPATEQQSGAPRPGAGAAARLACKRWCRIRALLVVGLLFAALTVIILQQHEASRIAREFPTLVEAFERGGRVPIVVLPFEDLSVQGERSSLADALTEEVLLDLDEHSLFAIATEPRDRTFAGALPAARDAGSAYVLSGSVRRTGNAVRITAQLVVAETGSQIWTAEFDEPARIEATAADQERIARRIAAVAAPYGPVFDVEAARLSAVPVERLAARDCMLVYYQYRRALDRALYSNALRCFERVTYRDAANVDLWAGLALLLTDGYAYGYAEDVDAGALLAKASEAARTAMDIDGSSVLAGLALARAQFFSGAEFQRTAEQVIARHPNNAEAASLVGSMLVAGGEIERGGALVDRAIALSPKAPGSYYAAQAIARLGARRYDEALASALGIDSPNWPTGDYIVMVAAALASRPDIAARARERLIDAAPGAAPAALFDRWPIAAELRVELVRGIELAHRMH